ncbi:carbohydrate ABC transporter substrate-binding protein [Allopusillimonas soli]|uniref:Carbohydrate ABC transporter substrate-binding protein n=1 Tax=Allopusillimonas soli TaxID=659016 RepID=A0A853F7J3_9BURK|nr:ABC transporter substrate-binding protein [Allopusillimonas soli]NYT35947.1 carbohydrate ABC transporter substrate-binding protein [Allopusillimonas soli]TEA76297.1 carbohydrate ABC transporter substrate-binding protein [Allopusillimonas soli]
MSQNKPPFSSTAAATPARPSRRRVLQAAGAAGLASIAMPLFRIRSAMAAERSLKILQWSHFVPSYDTWFDNFAKEWGKANGVNVVVDHINIGDLVTTTTSEMSAGSGHDLIELGPEAAQFMPNVLDMADINQEAGKQFGAPFFVAERVSRNPVTKAWYAFCHGWTIDCGDYRQSLWKKAGMPQGPDSWQELLEVGARIRDEQGVKVGIGMSQELDSNMAARSILWAWDTYVQDEWDNVVLNKGVFRRRAVEAVKYMTDLFQKAMTPAVFSWNAASNNQDLIAGQASYILNSISAYRSAQQSKPDIARDVFFTGPLAGPNGTRWANVHVLYNYIIPKFAKAGEDTAKQFILHLLKSYDQAVYQSKLYNSPSYFNTAVPDGERGYDKVDGASTLKQLSDAWFTHDPFKLDGEADGKLASLKSATEWTTNLGHPGYSSPAVGEVFNTFILPNMMAKAARGDLKPEEAVDEAAGRISKIYENWRKRGLIGGDA